MMPTRKELIEELNGNFDDLTDAVVIAELHT